MKKTAKTVAIVIGCLILITFLYMQVCGSSLGAKHHLEKTYGGSYEYVGNGADGVRWFEAEPLMFVAVDRGTTEFYDNYQARKAEYEFSEDVEDAIDTDCFVFTTDSHPTYCIDTNVEDISDIGWDNTTLGTYTDIFVEEKNINQYELAQKAATIKSSLKNSSGKFRFVIIENGEMDKVKEVIKDNWGLLGETEDYEKMPIVYEGEWIKFSDYQTTPSYNYYLP